MALLTIENIEEENENPAYKTEISFSYRKEKRQGLKKIFEIRTVASDKAIDQNQKHKRQIIDFDVDSAKVIVSLLKDYFKI